MADGQLEEAIQLLRRRWRDAKRPPPPPITLVPGCTFGAQQAQRVQDLAEVLTEIRTRVNQLIWAIIAAVAIQISMAVIKP